MPLAGARANASCRVFLRTGTAPRLWVSRGEDGEWGALRAARSRGCGFVPRGTDEAKLGLGWGFCQYLVRSEERRVGTESFCTCKSRWSPSPYKKNIISV